MINNDFSFICAILPLMNITAESPDMKRSKFLITVSFLFLVLFTIRKAELSGGEFHNFEFLWLIAGLVIQGAYINRSGIFRIKTFEKQAE